MSDVIRHVMIRGRVQGVGFRMWVEDTALERALAGWVRNRRDGAVEAVFAGPQDAVEAMVAACRNGPPSARVDAVDAEAGDAAMLALRPPGERFSVLRTV
jgi:acylphosphatase